MALEAVRVLAAVTVHNAGDAATVGYSSPPDTPAPGPPYLRVSRFRLLTVAADFVLSTILVGCTDDLFGCLSKKACKACKTINIKCPVVIVALLPYVHNFMLERAFLFPPGPNQ